MQRTLHVDSLETKINDNDIHISTFLFFLILRLAATLTMAALAVSHVEHFSGGVFRASPTIAWPAGGWGKCAM